MAITGEIKNLYSDRERTNALFPRTKVNAVSDDNGVGLDALLSEINTELDGKAPGAYGLGYSVNWDYPSANDIQVTGFYTCNVDVPSNAYWYGMHIRYDANSAYQYFTHVEQYYCAERRKINGVWQPWEWVNPPMTLGVEYRTTERWNDAPVYTMLINFGAMPNATTGYANNVLPKTMRNAVLTGYAEWVENGVYEHKSLIGTCDMWATVSNGNGYIGIKTSTDMSEYTAYIVAKYTKSTD